MPNEKPMTDNSDDKLWAVLSYFWIVSVLVLLLKKDSPFALYHAKQGLVLFIVSTVGGFIADMIPILGWLIIASLFSSAMLVLFIIGIMNSVQGKMVPLPVIGKYAEELKI
ncbi:MAG: DUF4870 domain-containing protein [Patescibacteria group bacterium]|jgi:uncharacterized membrane protein